MASQPLVSVVTPFYNTADYLAECIESVLRQTYQNWDYTLVDNCSTDGSTEIAQHYASRFPDRVRVIRNASFLSQVQNYNFALSQISSDSKYCKMVQADDWIFPECLENMVKVGEEHPRVGIVAAYQLEGEEISLDGLPYPSSEVDGRDICRRYFLKRQYLFGTPTSLLMRSEVIQPREAFYPERRAPFEDAHICFDLMKNWTYGFVHQVLTFSRRDNESILKKIRPFGYYYFLRLAIIVVHGRDYLSEEEHARLLREAEREYFLFLGKRALQSKSGEFWEFHRKRLASIDYSLDWRLWAKWAPLSLLEYIGNPKRSLEDWGARRQNSLRGGGPN